MNDTCYLDANATQPLRPAARDAVLAAFEVIGNPSSVHRPGRAARRILEDAREAIAGSFGGRPQDLVFTSGGTEADTTAIHAMSRGRRLIISAIEHDAVRSMAADGVVAPGRSDGVVASGRADGLVASWRADSVVASWRADSVVASWRADSVVASWRADSVVASRRADGVVASWRAESVVVPVCVDGVVDLGALDERLSDGVASLVCLMLANNETGVIQPVAEAAAICRRHGALLHMDAVQAAGRMPVRLDLLGAHSLALSSHKLGGPAGVGALLLAPDAPFAEPLISGGGQERGRRGGTPAVALIAGFAAATLASEADDRVYLATLRDAAERAAVACGAVVCGDPNRRLPNTTCIALPNVAAGVQVIALDLEKIAVSAGAACSSGKVQTSHVLLAMGLGRLAAEAIRVSLPWNVTPADIDAFATAYQRVAARLRPTVRAPLAPSAA